MIVIIELCIALGVIFVDLLTKGLAEHFLTALSGNSFTVIEGVFNFTFTRNTGAAWGMLDGQQWFFIMTAILASVVVVWILLSKLNDSKVFGIGLALILGGTLGNFYDRIAFGSVRDMLHVTFIDFPIFNVADCALCVGVGLVIVYILFIYKEKPKAKKIEENKEENDV